MDWHHTSMSLVVCGSVVHSIIHLQFWMGYTMVYRYTIPAFLETHRWWLRQNHANHGFLRGWLVKSDPRVMVAEWCQPRWSPTVRRASAADIGCGAIVVIPKYQPQRRLQIWIPSRGTCKNLTNKEPPPKFNVVFRPGKWVSALHRSLWGANDDIWGHSSLWKSGVNIIHRNYGYFTHYLHYHWCYMALSYFIIFFCQPFNLTFEPVFCMLLTRCNSQIPVGSDKV